MQRIYVPKHHMANNKYMQFDMYQMANNKYMQFDLIVNFNTV